MFQSCAEECVSLPLRTTILGGKSLATSEQLIGFQHEGQCTYPNDAPLLPGDLLRTSDVWLRLLASSLSPSRSNKAAGIIAFETAPITILPNPCDSSDTDICEMSNALQTTPYAPSAVDDVEEPPSVAEKKTLLPSVFSRRVTALKTTLPEKKTLLVSVFLWPVNLLLRHPFLLSVIISVILAGSVAGILHWSYYRDIQPVLRPLRDNWNGVSGIVFEVWTDTTYIPDWTHWP